MQTETRTNPQAAQTEAATPEPEHYTTTLPRLMDQRDLARYLGKSTAWCERARWAGEGPRFIKLGRNVRYRADDVMAWIEDCAKSNTVKGGA